MPKHFSVNYLSHHPEIKKVVFCVGHIDSYGLIQEIISCSNFEEVYLYASTKEVEVVFNRIGPIKIKGLSSKEFQLFDLSKKDITVVCLDLIDDEFYEKLGKKKINSIIVDFNWMGIDTFSIWESLRDNTDKIIIAQLKSHADYKVLDWEKDKKNDIELSLIFPVYNVGKYLQECIDTVTAWEAKYVEFLFVDDGSPDNSAEIITEASNKDKRIKLLRKANGGCASARQYGLERANGRYVGFIDPDDFVDKTMFKKLFAKALEYNADMSYCGYNEFYNDTKKSKPVNDYIYAPYFNGTESREQIDFLIPFLRIGIWRCIFLKDMLTKNNINFYTDLRRFDDLPFKVVTLMKSRYIVSVPEHLYYYRLDRKGQDIKADDEKLYVHFDIFKHLDEWFKGPCTKLQLDYYHIVKLDTHLWAIGKIQKRLLNEYCRRSKEDLLSIYNKKQLLEVAKTYCDQKKLKQLNKILNTK